jgi:GNAT superfamily N-acetyltransferase
MLEIYPSLPSERDDIAQVTRAAGVFQADELTTPLELFDAYVHDPVASGYYFLSASRDGRVVGYACYGPTPLTEGTFDLYWIVVESAAQGQGIGRAIFERVVTEITQRQGRLMMIWTSGTPAYTRTRSFYMRVGCKLEAEIRDFYRPDDDLCIFSFRVADS